MQTDNKLRFYKIMKYPVPEQEEIFYYKKKITKKIKTEKKDKKENKEFSRAKKNPLMEEYTTYIKKRSSLYQSLPFVKEIYLCNSITFNALNTSSDIDLFIICKKGALWRARFFSVLFFSLLKLKRNKKKETKRFCLSFYTTEDSQKLSNIKIHKDIYLAYWIAHLVPLYQEMNIDKKNKDKKKDKNIFAENKRVEEYIPNFENKQNIFLDIKILKENTRIKKILEKILSKKF